VISGRPGSSPESYRVARKNPQARKDLNTVSMVFDNGTQKLFLLDHRVQILDRNF